MIGMLFVSVVLTRFLPFRDYFRNLGTMVHEWAHAVMALVLSGTVYEIRLFADLSGVTMTSVDVGWKSALVGLAGYCGTSLFALFMFWTIARGRIGYGYLAILAVGVSSLIFVRNAYGLIWVLVFLVLTFMMWRRAGQFLHQAYYWFLSFLLLEDSVYSALTVLLIALLDPRHAGDATNLARRAFLPAVFWGALFAAWAVVCALIALRMFLRHADTIAAHTARGASGKATLS